MQHIEPKLIGNQLIPLFTGSQTEDYIISQQSIYD